MRGHPRRILRGEYLSLMPSFLDLHAHSVNLLRALTVPLHQLTDEDLYCKVLDLACNSTQEVKRQVRVCD